MYIIAKAIKGQEFMYSKKSAILCKSKKQAEILANFLNSNNETSTKNWKLQDNEIWFVYEIDNYSDQPLYKIKSTNGKIVIVENKNI